MSKLFRFTDADGQTYQWDRGQLDDTILEGPTWDTDAARRRIDALKVGQRMRRKGETLERIDGAKSKRKHNPRAPVALSKLHDLSEHGRVLDLQVREGGDVKEYSFGAPRPLLGWSPQADALVWWEGVKMPAARKANPLPAASAKVWERFHGKAPTRMREADVPIPKPWRRMGTAVNIGYRNHGRWGGDANHPFSSAPTVHRAGTRAPYLWIVRGGKLRMTARGIEG